MIVPARRVRRPPRARTRRIPYLPLLLAALLAVVIGGSYLLLRDDGSTSPGAAQGSRVVHLAGVAGFDPQGDNGDEHSNEAGRATDGNTGSAWTTEHYRPRGFTKDGVGLVLKAPRPVALSKVTVDGGGTPFRALIEAGNSQSGPFVPVSPSWRDVSGRVTFPVDTRGKSYAYYMVWLTLPSREGQAEINEVTART